MNAPSITDYSSPARAWWLVAVLCFGGFISYMHRLVLGVLVDPMGADLAIDDTRVSLLQGAAFAIVYVFAGLPLGRLVDRVNRRAVLVAGATVWSAGTLLCGLAPGFWALFGARCVVGIGEAALAPAAASMIADSFRPEQRGTALGIFLTGMVIGGPAAIGIGGFLLGAAEAGSFNGWLLVGNAAPWRSVLILFGLSGLILPLLMLTLREPERREIGTEIALSRVLAWVIAARGWLLPLLVGMALLSVGDYGLLSWVPTALARAFAWPPDRIGLWFGVITTVTGMAGALLGGLLSDLFARRYGERTRLSLAMSAALAGVLGATLVGAGQPEMTLIGLGVWTLASAIGATSGIAALQVLVPGHLRGVSMSLVAFCNTLLGLGLGPTAVALVSGAYDGREAVNLAIASVVAPAALLAALLVLLARRRPLPVT